MPVPMGSGQQQDPFPTEAYTEVLQDHRLSSMLSHINRDHALVGLKVWALCVGLGRHPHTLAV